MILGILDGPEWTFLDPDRTPDGGSGDDFDEFTFVVTGIAIVRG